jgi:hypothetical protein
MKRRTTEGLAELEPRLLSRLGDAEKAQVLLRWEVDGSPFLRLWILRDGSLLGYVWVSDDGTRKRRRLRGRAEVEHLLMRQLREPAGEYVLVFWEEEPTPLLRFWAMVGAGDRLLCVWQNE